MRRKHSILAALLCLFTLSTANAGTALAAQELTVSAAASLTDAFGEIGKNFEAANPGAKVVFNFAASGTLLQQIAKGAPVDVFASADQKTMDQAKEQNLILPDTRKDFAGNEMVLIVPVGAKIGISAIKGLTAKEVGKIALGNPETVPAGRYAREVLGNEGIWDELAPKLIPGESVRQVLDYVSRGEVDAAFVFSTDAISAKEKVKVVLEARNHGPITYPISVVSSSWNKELANRFVGFILSEAGQKVLLRYGFKKP